MVERQMPERIVRMSREVECLAGEGVTTACAERQYPPMRS